MMRLRLSARICRSTRRWTACMLVTTHSGLIISPTKSLWARAGYRALPNVGYQGHDRSWLWPRKSRVRTATSPCAGPAMARSDLESNFFSVEHSEQLGTGDRTSTLRAKKAFAVGDVLGPVQGTLNSSRHYTTVQYGPADTDHIRLDSDFVYVNHSCDPNCAFDLSSVDPSEWHLRALRSIAPGDDITFFYPSTEWELDQPFECRCASTACLGTIRGAKVLNLEQLRSRGFISPWILDAIAKTDGHSAL